MQTQAGIHSGSGCMGKIRMRLKDDLRMLPTSLLFTNFPPHSSLPRTRGLQRLAACPEFFLESKGTASITGVLFLQHLCSQQHTPSCPPSLPPKFHTRGQANTPPTPSHPQLSDLGSHPSNVKTRRANLPRCLSIKSHLWFMPNRLP